MLDVERMGKIVNFPGIVGTGWEICAKFSQNLPSAGKMQCERARQKREYPGKASESETKNGKFT